MDRASKSETGWNLENTYARLPDLFFTSLSPQAVSAPELVILNESLAHSLGLKIKDLKSKKGVEILSGSRIPEGSYPLAQAYGGHQFGHFAMLGDGRALLIGEQITPGGQRLDIQLKGSGKTPYSRGGDGRASLGPMLREYIISEAMHSLGVPSTRSLAVVTTGEPVIRAQREIGAILTRVASSHIRVGTFQYAANWGSKEDLKALADYTLERHFTGADKEDNKYRFLLKEVVKKQADLIAKWQLVGFIHGVMNTDNMALAGETIDYGPCAFMNAYDPKTVFSSIDRQGRYAYGNQPQIAAWNLARFAETLIPLLDEDQDQALKIAQAEIEGFIKLYKYKLIQGMRAKLGIFNEETEDDSLILELLKIMEASEADFTNTFKYFTLDKLEKTAFFGSPEFADWHKLWKERLERQEQSLEESRELMRKNNPAIIPRNHRVEEALKAAVEDQDLSVFENLLAALEEPYAYSEEQEKYSSPPEATDIPYQTFCGT